MNAPFMEASDGVTTADIFQVGVNRLVTHLSGIVSIARNDKRNDSERILMRCVPRYMVYALLPLTAVLSFLGQFRRIQRAGQPAAVAKSDCIRGFHHACKFAVVRYLHRSMILLFLR